jgi:hypothetical protein
MGCSPSTAYEWYSTAPKNIPREQAEQARAQILDQCDRTLQPQLR